jgi:hypothetical protein
MALQVEWFKSFGGSWYDLLEINQNHNHFNGMRGVYIIWHEGKKPAVLKVGQGIIRDCLVENKEDYIVAAYCQYGLYVTWAKVVEDDCDGVERYIGEALKPIIGHRLPDVQPIEVNLPWEESSIFTKE